MTNATYQVEQLYDKYGSRLYGIALEISPDREVAEEIMTRTFQKLLRKEILLGKQASVCVALIRLLIQTAH
ncbi:MAG: hypothetical protein SH856_09515 [Flavobacteriales bacterium]|nr:hypothetical protein [Flavobacteriales bacterium]